ncbi:CPBP family glutamic-type intramembrane protease [Croceibacterium atlanticum]|nr:CPBP family glutamic-type intramembrane protease [Croceibacterium atlanticum]
MNCSTLPAHAGWRGEWTGFFAFLRRPSLPGRPRGFGRASLISTLHLLPLALILTCAGLTVANLASLAAPQLPGNRLLDLPLGQLALFAILVAPITEETAFHGWLSGRPGHIAFIAIMLGGGAFALVAVQDQMLRAGLLIGTVAAACISLALLRRARTLPLFQQHFPWFYAASSGSFALLHIVNQSETVGWFSLVLVLPQLLIGLVLGYARVANGLWSSMLLHAGSNGVLVSLIAVLTLQAGAAA